MNPAVKRRLSKAFWRTANPITKPLAGHLRWWVLLESTGRRSGLPRVTPLAAGPREVDAIWLISVHGNRADYMRNIRAKPEIRLRYRGQWYAGTATIHDLDPDRMRGFNPYARLGPKTLGIEPLIVRVQLDRDLRRTSA